MSYYHEKIALEIAMEAPGKRKKRIDTAEYKFVQTLAEVHKQAVLAKLDLDMTKPSRIFVVYVHNLSILVKLNRRIEKIKV